LEKIPIAIFEDLFNKLKKLGLSLDVNHLELFIHVFISGLWTLKEKSENEKILDLKLLCKTLWLQKREFEKKFDVLFDDSVSHWFEHRPKNQLDSATTQSNQEEISQNDLRYLKNQSQRIN